MTTFHGRPVSSRESSYLTFTPRRTAIASFDNLIVLANYEEHIREARKIVWRDRGEPAVDIHDMRECLVHAARGGLRAGTIAFAIRSGVNLVLLLARIKNLPKKGRLSLVLLAGSFVALYRFILNALPILFPANVPLRENVQNLLTSLFPVQDERDDFVFDDSPASSSVPSPPPGPFLSLHISPGDRREARLSSSARVHQIWMRKKTRRWHSVFAGAVAGAIAISFEKSSRQIVIAQQLFVRGLQGSYNAYSERHGLRIPHGEVLVFALACGQIVYAYFLSPHTLPESYRRWLSHVIHVPKETITTHHSMVRRGTYDPADLTRILARPDLHPDNATFLKQWSETLPPYGHCALRTRTSHVARWTLPVYGALHFVPLLFFKRASFLRAPARMALRAAWGTARSTAFLAVAVVMYQGWFCGMQNAHRALVARGPAVPGWLLATVMSRPMHWLGGLITGLSVFVEAKQRRGELAMYVLPKGLESAWIALRGRGLVLHTGKYGNPLLTAFAMGMVMNDPQHLSGLVRRVLYQFIGPN
ncbi:hypothetical protein B0F90DRAFT_1807613 [Multifurca ochricompacta]|uniref:Transmembrane protein 135 N-terminal domain-containing protein n=1 Tax=Multifurca ochricompacta TaxID=376703 RepID=A0AAD4QQP4_9AGAM|nr:hypothetical protein B0F90DRAFT_1807613 [Multifurca ochricompacta]